MRLLTLIERFFELSYVENWEHVLLEDSTSLIK